ncbi:MAG: hypothetical protein LWY06_02510 [Firmicutes bacterium]|nr:hypothetical protein [Bacillota bacterium]
MPVEKKLVDDMLMAIAHFIEEGGLLQVCDINGNAVALPVILDELVLSKINRDGDKPTFRMGWRSIGLTARFESGEFNVEEPEFSKIIDFSMDDERLYFIRQKDAETRDMVCLSPLTEEYRGEWEDWNQFKKKHRDHFADIDLFMAQLMSEGNGEK